MALQLELFEDSVRLCFDLSELGHYNDEMDPVLLVILPDILDLILLSKLFKESLVVSGPLPNWKLSDLELSVREDLVHTRAYVAFLLALDRLDAALEALVPWVHPSRFSAIHHPAEILDNV